MTQALPYSSPLQQLLKLIRKERMRQGITQVTLAKQIGISPKRYFAIESGHSTLTLDMLAMITEHLDIQWDSVVQALG